MAIFRLTTASETRNGSNNADTFDGYNIDDGLGETGGTDTLSGRGGDDLFLLDHSNSPFGGLIDGGNDTDTVRAYGGGLGSFTFQNVEVLSIESAEFAASIAQLNAFSTITSSFANMPRIMVYLTGPGGTIDVSGRMAPGKAVEFNALGLSSGYDATGTDQDDVFKNSYYNDVVHGGLGADSFWGAYQDGSSGGTDQLYGEGGNDTFHLRLQSGTIDGGAGQDTVVAYQLESGFGSKLGDLGDATFLNVEKLSSGPNITFATIAQLNSFATITGGNSDKLIQFDVKTGAGGVIDFSTKLKQANEHIWLRAYGATSAVNVTGTARDDVLTGSAHDDTLSGGDGNDYLGGAEFAVGPHGTDTLVGGAGSDTYYVDPTDNLIELVGPAGGIDTIISTGSYDLADTAHLQGDFENLTLSGYLGAENPDTKGFGNALDNVITGNDGNNTLGGRAGADQLFGRGGDDTLNGGGGNDRLIGGSGNDLLTGGNGKDSFLFDTGLSAANNIDQIFDFSSVNDQVLLSSAIFTAAGPLGTLAAGAFVIGSGASDVDDRIIYDNTTGALSYDQDGTGAAAQIQFATLATGLALTNNNFKIV